MILLCDETLYFYMISLQFVLGMMGLTYRKLLVKCMLINVAAWLFAILFCAALGYSLEILGRPMSWYTTNWLAPCLYAIPALFVQIGIHQMAKRWLLNKQVRLSKRIIFF